MRAFNPDSAASACEYFRQSLLHLSGPARRRLGAALLLGSGPFQGLGNALRGIVDPGQPVLPKIAGQFLEPLLKIVTQPAAVLIDQLGHVFQEFLEQQTFGEAPGGAATSRSFAGFPGPPALL